MLQVTYDTPPPTQPPPDLTQHFSSQYANEAYDYPANIRESVTDLGRTVSEKVNLLSNATSPAEAQAALTAPPSAKPQPKTFSHAVARTALNASHLLTQEQTSSSEDPLATALEKYAVASEKVGEARLAQDAQIQSRFLAGWSTTLNTNIQFATRARKAVENSRLSLDATKASAKGPVFNLPGQAGRKDGGEEDLTEEARAKIEQAEDEFVGQTEEAVGVMKNVRPQHFFRAKRMAGANKPGPRHSRAPAQSRRPHRRTARIPQEGVRDSVGAGARRGPAAGRTGGA
jgi:hypothetical protein